MFTLEMFGFRRRAKSYIVGEAGLAKSGAGESEEGENCEAHLELL
jgi:hypothetical protein